MKIKYLWGLLLCSFSCFGMEDLTPETLRKPLHQFVRENLCSLPAIEAEVNFHPPETVQSFLQFLGNSYFSKKEDYHKFVCLSHALINGAFRATSWTLQQKQETLANIFYRHAMDGYFDNILYIQNQFPNIQNHLTTEQIDQILSSTLLYERGHQFHLLNFILSLNPSKNAIAKEIWYMSEISREKIEAYKDINIRLEIIRALYNHQPNLMFYLHKTFLRTTQDLDEYIIHHMRSYIGERDHDRIKRIKNFKQYLEFKAFEEAPCKFLKVAVTTKITLPLLDELSNPKTGEEYGAYLTANKDGVLIYQRNLFAYKDNERLAKSHISRLFLGILHINTLSQKIVTDAFNARKSEHADTMPLQEARDYLLDALSKAHLTAK